MPTPWPSCKSYSLRPQTACSCRQTGAHRPLRHSHHDQHHRQPPYHHHPVVGSNTQTGMSSSLPARTVSLKAAAVPSPSAGTAPAPEDVSALVERWLRWDTDPDTRHQVEQLRAGSQWAQLRELLGTRLEFGAYRFKESGSRSWPCRAPGASAHLPCSLRAIQCACCAEPLGSGAAPTCAHTGPEPAPHPMAYGTAAFPLYR